MISYTNETRVRDLPDVTLQDEVKTLFKTAMIDYGSDMTKEIFEHSYQRLAFLIKLKYKSLMLGEVKYVFDCLLEQIKGKLSVAAIMNIFSKYIDAKIEKQRQENEASEIEYESRLNDCFKSPLGSAIIHKMNLVETGALKMTEWESIPIKEIADKIAAGKIKVFIPEKKNKKYRWE